MAPDTISLVECGTGSDWHESIRLFHCKWDDDGSQTTLTITGYLEKFRTQNREQEN
jgi:hypothetical protein